MVYTFNKKLLDALVNSSIIIPVLISSADYLITSVIVKWEFLFQNGCSLNPNIMLLNLEDFLYLWKICCSSGTFSADTHGSCDGVHFFYS